MKNLNESLLESIDSIDDIIEESEMNVCAALYDEYQKMAILLEYADDDVVNEYEIVQEAFFMEAKKDTEDKTVKDKSSKKENVIISGLKKLGGIIRSIFRTIVSKIKQFANNIHSKGIKISENIIKSFGGKSKKNKSDLDKCREFLDRLDELWLSLPKLEVLESTDKLEKLLLSIDNICDDARKKLEIIRADFVKEFEKDFNQGHDEKDETVKIFKHGIIDNINDVNTYLDRLEKNCHEYKEKYKRHADHAKLDQKAMSYAKKEIAEAIKSIKEEITHLSDEFKKLTSGSLEVDVEKLTKFLEIYILYHHYSGLLNNEMIENMTSSNHINIKWMKDFIKKLDIKKKTNSSSVVEIVDNFADDMAALDANIKIDKEVGKLTIKIEKQDDGYIIKDISFIHEWNMIPVYLMNSFEDVKKEIHRWYPQEIIDVLNKNVEKIVDKFNNVKMNSKYSDMFSSNLSKTLEIAGMKLFDFNNEFIDGIVSSSILDPDEKELVLQKYADIFTLKYRDFMNIMQIFYFSMKTAIGKVGTSVYYQNRRS